MEEHHDWYTVNEVADRLRVHTETVYRWIRAGELGYLDLGGRAYRVRREDLDALVEARFRPPRAQRAPGPDAPAGEQPSPGAG